MVTILMVDDNPLDRQIMRRALEKQGIGGIQEADCLATARRLLDAMAEPPTLVLCDFHLPDGDGLEFLKQVDCPERVLLSAEPPAADAAPGIEILEKPWTQQACMRLAHHLRDLTLDAKR